PRRDPKGHGWAEAMTVRAHFGARTIALRLRRAWGGYWNARGGRHPTRTLEQTAPDRLRDDLRTISGSQRAVEVGDDLLYGPLGIAHAHRNLTRAASIRHQLEHAPCPLVELSRGAVA